MNESSEEWFTCYNAKIVKYNGDGTLNLSIEDIDSLLKQIGWWNMHTEDIEDGYEIRIKKNQYSAPETLINMTLPYLEKECSILDLGCGTGSAGRLLPEGYAVDGIDFSENMLSYAKKAGYKNLYCVSLEQNDFGKILTENVSYRALISVGVYGDYVEPHWVSGALRILDKGGIAAIAGIADNLENRIFEILKNEGFEIRESKKAFAHFNEDKEPMDYLYIIGIKR